MDEQRQDVQLEPTYNCSVPIQNVALKTCWKRWTIGRGGEKGSGISVMMAWDDDVCYATFGIFILQSSHIDHNKILK